MQKDELDATHQIFGDDFAELAHLFLGDTPKRLALLRIAITAKDAAESRRIAHVLCGSSASIGANVLAGFCLDLEIKAKNNELEDALARLNTMELEYTRVDTKLHDMLHAPIQTMASTS